MTTKSTTVIKDRIFDNYGDKAVSNLVENLSTSVTFKWWVVN